MFFNLINDHFLINAIVQKPTFAARVGITIQLYDIFREIKNPAKAGFLICYIIEQLFNQRS